MRHRIRWGDSQFGDIAFQFQLITSSVRSYLEILRIRSSGLTMDACLC